MKESIDVCLKDIEGDIHIVMKCKCCEFALTHLIEDVEIKVYLTDIVDNMSLIFDEKKKG